MRYGARKVTHSDVVELGVAGEHVERQQVPGLVGPHRRDALDCSQRRAQLRDLRDVSAIGAVARVRRRAALDSKDWECAGVM